MRATTVIRHALHDTTTHPDGHKVVISYSHKVSIISKTSIFKMLYFRSGPIYNAFNVAADVKD